MKYLSIILLFIITACSTGAEPEPSIYPYTNGTWEVTSPDSAHWIGQPSKAKSRPSSAAVDTLILYSPNGQSLMIIDDQPDEPQGYFKLSFTDSTDSTVTSSYDYNYEIQLREHPIIEVSSNIMAFWPDRFTAYFNVNFSGCSNHLTYEFGKTLQLDLLKRSRGEPYDSSKVFRTYIIEVAGFEQTIKDIVCS